MILGSSRHRRPVHSVTTLRMFAPSGVGEGEETEESEVGRGWGGQAAGKLPQNILSDKGIFACSVSGAYGACSCHAQHASEMQQQHGHQRITLYRGGEAREQREVGERDQLLTMHFSATGIAGRWMHLVLLAATSLGCTCCHSWLCLASLEHSGPWLCYCCWSCRSRVMCDAVCIMLFVHPCDDNSSWACTCPRQGRAGQGRAGQGRACRAGLGNGRASPDKAMQGQGRTGQGQGNSRQNHARTGQGPASHDKASLCRIRQGNSR